MASSSGVVPPALCGGAVSSRRGLLASLWSIVVCLTAIAFILALIFTLSAKNSQENYDDYYNNQYEGEEGEEGDRNRDNNGNSAELAVTSRAMAFAALWTAVLATLMAVFGAVILGWQSPYGTYYTCCSSSVHKTTPLALGSFIGALLMFANLTLVCSVLFGEFDIRDYREGENNNPEGGREDTAVRRSSMAFSIMCMFLTVLYAGFAGLTFSFSRSILEELEIDEREEMQNRALGIKHHNNSHFVGGGYDGYIGERFDVRRSNAGPGSFVGAPNPDKSIL